MKPDYPKPERVGEAGTRSQRFGYLEGSTLFTYKDEAAWEAQAEPLEVTQMDASAQLYPCPVVPGAVCLTNKGQTLFMHPPPGPSGLMLTLTATTTLTQNGRQAPRGL